MSGAVRYTDKDGDVWEYDGSGYAHIVCHDGRDVPAGDGATLTLDQLIARYGPISLAPDRCAEIRTAALETVLAGLPYTVGGTGENDDGTVRVHVPGAGAYTIDVTVTEVGA